MSFLSCDENSHNFSCEKCVSCDSHEKNFNFPRAIKSHTYRVNERKMKISNFIRIFFAGSSSSYCCIEKP